MKQNVYENRGLYNLKLEILKVDPNQPRKHFDKEALDELAKSIKELGVLQPIIFRVDAEGNHIIVAGERRFRAAGMAGLKEIPAVYTDGNSMEIALVENIIREDLTPVEEAEALLVMQEEHGYTHEQLARVLGKSRVTITEILSINKLPEEVKRDCREDVKCSRGKLIEIAREKSPKKMVSLYNRVKNMNLSKNEIAKMKSRRTEGKASDTKEANEQAAATSEISNVVGNPIVKCIEELSEKLEMGREHLSEEQLAEVYNKLDELIITINEFKK